MLPKGRHYHPLNGRGYGHVTVLKFLPFAVMQRVARVRQLSTPGLNAASF